MVSRTEMLKAVPRTKLASALKKKRKKVAKSWNKTKIAAQLSFDELKKLYASLKLKVKPDRKKVVKRKVVKKKPARKKVVKRKVVKKKPARKKVVKKKVAKKRR